MQQAVSELAKKVYRGGGKNIENPQKVRFVAACKKILDYQRLGAFYHMLRNLSKLSNARLLNSKPLNRAAA